MVKHFISIALLSALAACGGGGGNTTSTDPVVPAEPSAPVIERKNIPTEFRFSKQDAWIVVNFSMGEVLGISVNNNNLRGVYPSPDGQKLRMDFFKVGKNNLILGTAEANYVGDIVFSESDLTGIVTRPWDGGGFYSENKYFAVIANHPDQGIQVAVSIDGGPFIPSDEPRCLQIWPTLFCPTDFGYVTEHPKLTAGEHSVTAKMTTKTGKVFFALPLRFTVPN